MTKLVAVGVGLFLAITIGPSGAQAGMSGVDWLNRMEMSSKAQKERGTVRTPAHKRGALPSDAVPLTRKRVRPR